MDDDEDKLFEAGYIKASLWLSPLEHRVVHAVLAALRHQPEGPQPLSPEERDLYKRFRSEVPLSKPKKKPPEGGS